MLYLEFHLPTQRVKNPREEGAPAPWLEISQELSAEGGLLPGFEKWVRKLNDIHGDRNQFKITVVYYLEMLKTRKSEVMEKIKAATIPVKEEMMSVAEQLRQEGRDEMMSIADQLRQEGRDEMKREAEKLRQKEREDALQEMKFISIINMLQKGFDVNDICDVLEVSREQVESVREELG